MKVNTMIQTGHEVPVEPSDLDGVELPPAGTVRDDPVHRQPGR